MSPKTFGSYPQTSTGTDSVTYGLETSSSYKIVCRTRSKVPQSWVRPFPRARIYDPTAIAFLNLLWNIPGRSGGSWFTGFWDYLLNAHASWSWTVTVNSFWPLPLERYISPSNFAAQLPPDHGIPLLPLTST